MDFDIVKRQIIQEYIKLYGNDNSDFTFSLSDCIKIFRYFYTAYYDNFHKDHPHLKNSTIKEIIEMFPYSESPTDYGYIFDYEPAEYPAMIDAYFKQSFKNCNYSIAHFMSGQIRALRFYEELY
jgi:hypothetical protein